MKIDVLTLFPEMFSCVNESILGRALKDNKLEVNIINIRDFSKDKHQKCDDAPFGGGAGMVMLVQPIYDAVKAIKTENSLVILTSPRGEVFSQKTVVELAKYNHIIIICGHYEGVDERVIDLCSCKLISLGDFVLTGGEIPAMAILDAVARYVPEVINAESLTEESFSSGLLEYPQYTRPQEFMGRSVPEVLLSGHHLNIEKWRYEQSMILTKKHRPDLLNTTKKG